ncbi:MAG: hypothetical protein QGI89_01730 [Candidatus Woesearchaeota archaeon]|jgi:hypothetical protein|nr:hypothetical protein [Candidatus Woesearchaeota archaeon]HJO02238.1 hypothetical protein [Candidatus Woesearchaeota archaeon]|tara:strand:+ start:499 stop:2229 length:1731 start_codon:yes stop_codon:yes gene_type:complete
MKKFPLIACLTVLLFAVSVNAASGFNIIEDSANATGSAGSTASGSFTVNNTGTTNLDINFTGYTLTKGSDQLSISSLSNITNLANGSDPQTATFSVVIPTQKAPGLYTGTLTGTSNESNVDTVTINANVTPTYSVSTIPASEMDLGSASVNTTYTKTFNITNTGNANITNVTFDFSESGFNLQSNETNFILDFNETETIQFNITIPSSSSTGNVTLGSVKLVSTELPSKTLFSVKANVGGGLEIEDLDVFLITRKSESGNDLDVPDGKKLNFDDEDVGPESELRFNFNIENTFTDEENIDINDITVKVTLEEIDDGDDIEEESNEFDLDSDKNEDVDVHVNIPLSVDVGVYDVVIEVLGDDDDGNEHTAQMNLKIDIDKEARDVVISELSLFPKKIKCSGSSTLTATIKNIGSRIEKEAGIGIINEDLGINFVKQNFVLEEDPFDSDNEFTKKLIINIDGDTTAGTYPMTANAYIHESALWETKTVNLEVEGCSQVEELQEEEEEEINETESVETGIEAEEGTAEGEEVPVLGPTTTTEVSFTKKPLFLVLMAILNFVIIVAVAFLIVKVIKKREF